MAGDGEDRASLINRQLPEMTLSTGDNPLTKARPPPQNLKPAEKAQFRFEVHGNAISMSNVGLYIPLPSTPSTATS